MEEFKMYEAVAITSKGEEIKVISRVAKRSIDEAKRYFNEFYSNRRYLVREI